jgi:hypothetical protein
VLPLSVQSELDDTDESLGVLGHPFDRGTPFFIGLTGALGVAIAYVLARGIADITSVLVIIGLALFIAIGLNPIITFLTDHRMSRGLAVAIVTFGFLALIARFVLVAVPPISHEVSNLISNFPHYKAELAAGKGWAGRLAVKLHLTGYLKGKSQLKLPVSGGILGAGKVILTRGNRKCGGADHLLSDRPAGRAAPVAVDSPEESS